MTVPARARQFGAIAEEYERFRAPYAGALMDALVDAAGGTGARVLEIGAGTGKATRDMVSRGLRVVALEPDARMVRVLRQLVAAGVEVHEVAFEDYTEGEGEFDLVVCASAWHWLDPQTRWQRVARMLRPGGTLAVIWNYQRILDTDDEPGAAIQARVDAVHVRLTPGIEWPVEAVTPDQVLSTWPGTELADHPGFEAPRVEMFGWQRSLRREEFVAFLATHSLYFALGEDQRAAFYAALGEALPDVVPLDVDSVLVTARRG